MILLSFAMLVVLVFTFSEFFYRILVSFFVAYMVAAIAATFYMAYCMAMGAHPADGAKIAYQNTKDKFKRFFSWKKKVKVAPATPA